MVKNMGAGVRQTQFQVSFHVYMPRACGQMAPPFWGLSFLLFKMGVWEYLPSQVTVKT